MKLFDWRKEQSSGKSISVRFRNINLALFIFALAVIALVMMVMLRNIASSVSKDYAMLYSTNTARNFSIHLNKEIALMKKAASAKVVTDWFADEYNHQKKEAAHEEMLEIIDVLSSDNIYIAIESSLHEFTVEQNYTVDDIQPYATLTPGYFDDSWYFELTASDYDYALNVDIDKILHRKRVWINYKVVGADGGILGVICSGLEFDSVVEAQLGEYDNTKVRVVIIDENGVIQMDNKSLGQSDFLVYEQVNLIEEEVGDPAFKEALDAHLASIDGFFASAEPIVIKMAGGRYNYATIVPIEATNWSVVTFYDSSWLFNLSKLYPLFAIMLLMFICFMLATGAASYRLLFRPVELLINSLSLVNRNEHGGLYGVERDDEIGCLSRTIQEMKGRLDSYATDLEREVAERSADLKRAYEQVWEQNQIILSSIDYARKIQTNLLPEKEVFAEAFQDYSIIWEPRDVVGGDIYWLKNFEKGSVLCVCDCTGHGTPGALLTMLVASSLETIVNESSYTDTAEIVWRLEQRFVDVFRIQNKSRRGLNDIKDGCDLAVLFVSKDGSIKISAGNTNVFVCNGKEGSRIKGQRIYIGEGRLKSKEDVKVVHIEPNSNNKLYIASDGLFDQIGEETERPFGYKSFMRIIYENHTLSQKEISQKVWEAFEEHRGSEVRRDDIELISFSIAMRVE